MDGKRAALITSFLPASRDIRGRLGGDIIALPGNSPIDKVF